MKCAHVYAHEGGITHLNSRTTISLQHCVIITGLECIQNAKTPLLLNHIPLSIILPARIGLSYLWLFHFEGERGKNEYIKGMGGGELKWRDNHFFFESMKICRVKVIMGCRQWEERHSELISLANREPPCFDPSVGFSLCLRAHHTMSSVAN